jgi:protein gp37
MAETTIQWCDYTFNPWIGCQRVSPGCEHCYAEARDHHWRPGRERWGPNAPRERTSSENWRKPLRWDREAQASGIRRRVFCASLADVFEDRAELIGWREDLFDLIAVTPYLDWLLLTKRPENIQRLWSDSHERPNAKTWPTLWLGTTVEDQRRAHERIPALLQVPAAVHFLSCEPLLEPVRLQLDMHNVQDGVLSTIHIDWVIVGGESGGGARPFEAEWARSILKQCRKSGVKAFVKQMGAYVVDRNDAGFNGEDEYGWHSAVEYGGEIRVEDLDHGYQGAPVRVHLRDRAGGDPAEWPEELRVREFPEVRRG